MVDARRAGLLAAKLRALVTDGWPGTAPEPRPLPAGAACVEGARGWALIDERTVEADPLDGGPDAISALPPGWLGGVVVWAARQGVDELHVIADTMGAADARRASVVTAPALSLWRSVGRRLDPVTPSHRTTRRRSIPGCCRWSR